MKLFLCFFLVACDLYGQATQIPASGGGGGSGITQLTGDATAGPGSGSVAVTVTKINGTSLAGLATGILKNTTTTGVPSIAVAGDFPTLNQNTTGNAATATALAANQGTTTTVLHGNAAGTPSFGAIVNADITNSTIDLTTKVTGALPGANMATMVGDSGSGGTKGAVPAPSAGDAAAGKFLKADGTWAVPAGGGSGCTTSGSANQILTDNGSGGCTSNSSTLSSGNAVFVGSVSATSFASGSGPPSVTAGTGGVDAYGEGTAPSAGCPATGVDCIYADSTAHALKASFNNDTASQLVRFSNVTVATGKTLTANNSITLAGTDSTTMTFPSTSQTIPGMNQANTAGSSFTLDVSAASDTGGLKVPTKAAAVPTADGFIAHNSTNHTLVFGTNGATGVAAIAATGTSTDTTCGNQVITAISGVAIPTCTTVTAARMDATVNRRVCDIAVGDTSGSAITNAQLGPQKRICYIPAAATVVEMDVAADGGTPNVIVAKNSAGTPSNIVSAALATAASGGIACSNTGGTTGIDGVTTCSATLQNTSLAAGDYLELISGTAGGTAKLMTIHIIYTIN